MVRSHSTRGLRKWSPRDRTALDQLLDTGHWRTEPTQHPMLSDLTYPAGAPHRIIDWVFVTPSLRIVEREVIHSTLSDHLPVRVDVEVCR